jgi:FkbM family methyltransferase
VRTVEFAGQQLQFSGSARDAYFTSGIPRSLVDDPVFAASTLYVKDDAVVIDVGANIGVSTAAYSLLTPHGSVHCFEPSPANFGYLQQNVLRNGLTNTTLNQRAVSAQEGSLSFVASRDFGAGSFVADETTLAAKSHHHEIITVPCETLDHYVQRNDIPRVDVIKIDVEGHELSVLAGARATLDRFKPMVVVEFNSYTITAHGNVLTPVFLETLFETFPHTALIHPRGRISPLRTDAEKHSFLHDNMTSGRVDNLLCTFAVPQTVRSPDALQIPFRSRAKDLVKQSVKVIPLGLRRTLRDLLE